MEFISVENENIELDSRAKIVEIASKMHLYFVVYEDVSIKTGSERQRHFIAFKNKSKKDPDIYALTSMTPLGFIGKKDEEMFRFTLGNCFTWTEVLFNIKANIPYIRKAFNDIKAV